MTTLEPGRQVRSSPSGTNSLGAVLPFHRFVMDGEGDIQSQVLSRFLHTLNNLLTVTNGYVSLLDSTQSFNSSLRDLHDEAINSGERAADISRALQSLALGQPVPTGIQPAFIDELIRKIEPLLSAVSGRQVPIHLDLGPGIGPVLLNPLVFLRIVTACIADAQPDTASTSIQIAVSREERTGSDGISQAVLRITNTAASGKVNGSVSFTTEALSNLVQPWNGEVRWIQTEGAHWDLRILLPICDEQQVALCDGAETSVSTRPCWRVLVVEENATHLRHLESGLLDAGLAVASFTRGAAALESIRQDPHHYNLVITDILGSDLTGLELARALRMESPCTHVVFSTSADRLPAVLATTNAPVLPKPFDMARVLETVDTLCGTVRPRILVADDEESIRLLVRQCLSEDTYELLEAEDGMQACEVLQRSEIQLLIVDLVMPAHEGLETIRSICRRGHKLKILAISGQRPEYLKAAGLLGADAVLRKPFSPADLRATVGRLLKKT